MNRLLQALAAYLCPSCGWWAETGHICHPADRN